MRDPNSKRKNRKRTLTKGSFCVIIKQNERVYV